MSRSVGRALVAAAALGACALAVHTAINVSLVRRPRPDAPPVSEPVDVLIPARDEQAHIGACLESVRAQDGVDHLRITVLDDDSSDTTADIVAAVAQADARVELIAGDGALPAGWLGKPWACARLGEQAAGSVLVFVDADVHLEPDAIRGLVEILRTHDLAMVAPYPRQAAGTVLERLVQPLITWSWAATMPVRVAEGSLRPSLAAANGQVIVVDADAYRHAGGHGAVAGQVLEDIELMRAFKRAGLRCATVDGSRIASCRMYSNAGEVVDGYAKSLWAAFNGPLGSIAANAGLAFVYVLPFAAMTCAPSARTRAWGTLGYGAAVASRIICARTFGDRAIPDALAHPVSIGTFVALTALSWQRRARGTATWKGRALTAS